MSSMASQYTSPRLPPAPQSTPAHGSARLRAPIHNPYDKFTRQEFDAWIGDLTSNIRRVLAHDEDLGPSASGISRFGDTSAFEDDDVAEDSFAEVKARRAAKGKTRAVELDESAEEEYVKSIIFVGDEDGEDEEASEEEEDGGEAEYDSEDNEDGTEYVNYARGARAEPEAIEISSDEEEVESKTHEPADEDDEQGSEDGASEDDNPPASRAVVDLAEEENAEQSEEEYDEDGRCSYSSSSLQPRLKHVACQPFPQDVRSERASWKYPTLGQARARTRKTSTPVETYPNTRCTAAIRTCFPASTTRNSLQFLLPNSWWSFQTPGAVPGYTQKTFTAAVTSVGILPNSPLHISRRH